MSMQCCLHTVRSKGCVLQLVTVVYWDIYFVGRPHPAYHSNYHSIKNLYRVRWITPYITLLASCVLQVITAVHWDIYFLQQVL